MALVKNAARNGAVCYHHDSKEMFVLLCLFLPQGPTVPKVLSIQEAQSGSVPGRADLCQHREWKEH